MRLVAGYQVGIQTFQAAEVKTLAFALLAVQSVKYSTTVVKPEISQWTQDLFLQLPVPRILGLSP